jgi:hypothetical protein
MRTARAMALVVLFLICKIEERGGSTGFGDDTAVSFVFDSRHSELDERSVDAS